MHSWDLFDRLATPVKVYHCFMFDPLVDNGSQHGLLE